MTKTKESKQIMFRVSPAEYVRIKDHAERSRKTVSAYVKEMALNRCVIDYNYKAISDHTETINIIKARVTTFLNYLLGKETVYPADLKHLAELLNELTEGEKKMLVETARERKQFREYVKKLHE